MRKREYKLITFLFIFAIIGVILCNYQCDTHDVNINYAFLAYYKYLSIPQTTVSDTWDITTTVIIDNQTLIINRRVIIHDRGLLVLRNSALMMDSSQEEYIWIEVCSGGNLIMINSTITSLNSTNCYYMSIANGAYFYMDNSEVSYAGISLTDKKKSGLWINTSNVVINASRMHHNLCGMYIIDSYNNTIANNLIFDNTFAIYVEHTNSTIFANNKIINNDHGLFLIYSFNNTIKHNVISNGDYGIVFGFSHDSNIVNNTISNCKEKGIELIASYNNAIVNNTLSECAFAVYLHQPTVVYAHLPESNIFVKNTFSANSEGNILIGNTITHNRYGIALQDSHYNAVINNTLVDNYYGITIDASKNNILVNNVIIRNQYGITLQDSYYNTIINNTIINNHYGISIDNSKNNILTNNTLDNINSNTRLKLWLFDYASENNVAMALALLIVILLGLEIILIQKRGEFILTTLRETSYLRIRKNIFFGHLLATIIGVVSIALTIYVCELFSWNDAQAKFMLVVAIILIMSLSVAYGPIVGFFVGLLGTLSSDILLLALYYKTPYIHMGLFSFLITQVAFDMKFGVYGILSGSLLLCRTLYSNDKAFLKILVLTITSALFVITEFTWPFIVPIIPITIIAIAMASVTYIILKAIEFVEVKLAEHGIIHPLFPHYVELLSKKSIRRR